MRPRLLLALVVLAVAPAAAASPGTVKLTYFGEVSVDEGDLVVMDGGIHGVQGHTIHLQRDGHARWERRVEGLQPSGKPGAGSFQPRAEELRSVRAWADEAWRLAGTKQRAFYPAPAHGPPRWVWAIVLRRDGHTRTLEGGADRPLDGAPGGARDLLAWLIATVDALARGPAPAP